MCRRKVSKVIKSPFKLRQRKISDGRISLFIDFIKNGNTSMSFLIFIFFRKLLKKLEEKTKKLVDRLMRFFRNEPCHI